MRKSFTTKSSGSGKDFLLLAPLGQFLLPVAAAHPAFVASRAKGASAVHGSAAAAAAAVLLRNNDLGAAWLRGTGTTAGTAAAGTAAGAAAAAAAGAAAPPGAAGAREPTRATNLRGSKLCGVCVCGSGLRGAMLCGNCTA